MSKFFIALFVLACVWCASCSYEKDCIPPEYYILSFAGSDTAVIAETFAKDGSFTTRKDSLWAKDILNGSESLVSLHRFYSKEINRFDWKLTLIPSGKVFKITNITIIDREEKIPQSNNRQCGDDVNILVNGVSYQQRVATDVTSTVRFDIK